MRRFAAVLIYAAIFAGEVLWNGFVPLVPQFSDRYDLTKVQSGVLLAATSAAILAVSAPAAAVCERFGPRRLTAASSGVIALSSVWTAHSSSFAGLVGSRLLFGVGFGVIWVTGLRWLSDLAGARESQALAFAVTTAGLSSVVGPAVGATSVAHFGLGPTFMATAVVNGLLALALWFEPTHSGVATPERQLGLRAMVAQSRGERLVWVSALVAGTAGLMGAVVNLLVPLQLHANGMTTSVIGIAFGAAALVFLVSSGIVAHFGRYTVRVKPIAWVMTAAIAVLLVPVASQATAALVAFLLLRAPINAYLFSAAFPLGAIGARRAGVSVGAVAALINGVWAVSTLAGPLVFGAIAQSAGDQAAFVLLMAVFATSLAVIVGPERRLEAAAALIRPRG